MADHYYIGGYTPPAGIDNSESVREMQRRLGVKADGIWGPKTDAAYYNSSAGAGSMFQSFFDTIMGSINIPTISVNVPGRAQLTKEYTEALRPGVDQSIENRKAAGERSKAELDADAAARGMGASTYVSSMKEREADDVERDVASLESQFTAALAERVSAAMQQYAALQLQASTANAQIYSSFAQNAMDMASGWYTSWLASRSKRGGSGGSGSAAFNGLSYVECRDYVNSLNSSSLWGLLNSSNSHWTPRREEMRASLTDEQFSSLTKYGQWLLDKRKRDSLKSGAGGGTKK